MTVLTWKTTRDGFVEDPQPVAPHDGKYLLDGVPFRVFAGSPLPPGAVMIEPEAKAEAAAPENKAEPAPENKARRGKRKDAE